MEMTDIKSGNGHDVDEVEHGSGHEKSTSLSQGQNFHGLERYINLSSIAFFGFVTLSSWESFASAFAFALISGGPASMVYGALIAGIGMSAVGCSLAELASIDPCVGAQYRWSANFAPFAPRFWGLMQGWITVSAWCFAAAGPCSIIANTIISLVVFNNPSYEPQRWHTSLLMIATLVIPFVMNLWFRKVLNAFELISGVLHIVLFIVVIVVLITMGPRSDSAFVWNTSTKGLSGWNNGGVTFGLGLLSCSFSVGGVDALLHMSDEVRKVRTRVPRSILVACIGNGIMMFVFVVVLLYSIGPIDPLLESSFPLINVLYTATGSKAGTTTLVALMNVIFFCALFNCLASISRLVWTFAKDRGMPFHEHFAYIHPTLKLPLNALALVGVIVCILSLIYIGSATAFNAVISLQAIALNVSYMFPILFFLIRRLRGPEIPYGAFRLGKFGVAMNILGLCYLVYVVIWMPFPQFLPVTAQNFNYAGPIVGVVIILALLDWFISGRKRFEIPLLKYE